VKLLLDTCTFLWLVEGASDLSSDAREAIVDPGNDVLLSSVSAWEIAVKHGLGRLKLKDSPSVFVPRERERHRIAPLALDERAVLSLSKLPPLHRDPFDRMLICQAVECGLSIVTPDPLIRAYPVSAIW